MYFTFDTPPEHPLERAALDIRTRGLSPTRASREAVLMSLAAGLDAETARDLAHLAAAVSCVRGAAGGLPGVPIASAAPDIYAAWPGAGGSAHPVTGSSDSSPSPRPSHPSTPAADQGPRRPGLAGGRP